MLHDVSKGRPANTNADRRRGPRIDPEMDAMVRDYFACKRVKAQRRRRRETLWFPKLDERDV